MDGSNDWNKSQNIQYESCMWLVFQIHPKFSMYTTECPEWDIGKAELLSHCCLHHLDSWRLLGLHKLSHLYLVAVWAYYNPSKSRTSTKLPKDHSKNDQALVVGIIIWPKSTKWVLKINIISSIPRSYHCTPWHRCKLPVVPPDQTDPQWRRRDTCRSTPGSARVMCRVRCMRDMV